MGRRRLHSGSSETRSLPAERTRLRLAKPCAARNRAFVFAIGLGRVLSALRARPAHAWGRLAHRASAKLADSRLSPRTRAIIRELLEPGESLADASTWADEHSREIPGSMFWHFVNVPIWAPHYDPRDCRPQGCVVSKIADFKATLQDRNAPVARRRTALRFLVHLVQDVHQPMHVADRNDRGGNNLQLRYGRYDNTNLHQVWDSGLLSRAFPQRRRPDAPARGTLQAARGARLARTGEPKIGPTKVCSSAAALTAYPAPGRRSVLAIRSAATTSGKTSPKAVDRLARSGVRLAAVLEEVFKDADPRADPIRGIRTESRAAPAGK